MHRDPVLEIGNVFQDRYRVQEMLSSGGFAVVYRAEQLATGQTVAIKCIRQFGPTPADDERRLARFQREIGVCAQLHHPNIVRLLDSGRRDVSMYAVFEYVPGKNLAQILAEEGRLTPMEAGHLMSQVLDALSCAHDAGILHRDLKPANIMVVPTGARRNAMVLDFGISGVLHDVSGLDEQSLTRTFEHLGTPAYASPEQLHGHLLTARADIYSWGLVFLECLTGRRAIEGATIAEIMHRQLDDTPVPIPPMLAGHPLEELLRASTAKDETRRRFGTRELLARLDVRALAGLDRASATAGPGAEHAPVLAHAAGTRTEVTRAEPDEGSPPGIGQDERRQLTLVSCAVSIAVSGGRPLDLEEHEVRLSEAVALCRTRARTLGGHLLPSAEHRVLLCFGYPTATGEDARRAVHAALAIAAELASHGAQQEVVHGIRSQVQIGVHTGLVLVRREGQDVHTGAPATFSGSAVRLAARLDEHAPMNEVVISPSTCSLVRTHFAVSADTPVHVPGRSEPLAIFRVAEAPSEELLFAHLAEDHTPLVGREAEMRLLRQHWLEASKGHGQSVLIIGEPGIGKSRLVRELIRQLGSGHGTDEPRLLHGRCMPEHRHNALQPVIELLQRHLGLRADIAEVEHGERWRRLQELCDAHGMEGAVAMPLLASLLGVPLDDGHAPLSLAPPRQRELTLRVLLSLFSDMAARQPAALIIEDAHWADASTLELLGFLLAEVAEMPMLVVLTARPGGNLPTAQTRLMLDRLDSTAAGKLIERCGGDRAMPAAVASEILRRTEGVPLFIEAMVSTFLDSGMLAAHEDRDGLSGTPPGLEIPVSLRELVLGRVDRLSREARATLQLGAVLGREFRFEELAAADSHEGEALGSLLDALMESGLLYRRRRMNGEIFAFKHALIHDAIYDSIPRRIRAGFHRRIAQVLEERFPEVVEKRPEFMARHHAGAGQIVEALGHARRAVLDALAKSANQEAIGYARQAIAWLDDLADEKQRAELELGFRTLMMAALFSTRGHGDDDFGRLAQRSLALIELVGDSPHVLPILFGLWMRSLTRSELTQALALAERYLDRAEHLADEYARLQGASMRAHTLLYMGHYDQVYAAASVLLTQHRPRSREHSIMSMGTDDETALRSLRAQSAWMLGHLSEAWAEVGAALARATALRHPGTLCLVLLMKAKLRLWSGEHADAESAARELVACAERHGFYAWLKRGQAVLGGALRDAAHLRAALDELTQAGQLFSISFLHAFLADAEVATGDHDRALTAIDEARRLAESTGEHHFLAEIYRRHGEIRAAQPDPASRADAESSFRRAIEVAEEQGARLPAFLATAALCRLQARDGRVDPAILASLRALDREIDDDDSSPVVAGARAVLASLGG